ncbi:hypothetical protein JX265_009859 [Neoarthrinium moseri]|uniref:Lectin n=1 Tax=Neoarthrinium moseri TaxID=1658444 RepID=A0A9Q0AIV3_9PEZI|nr:uncharacterized protein JN550_008499 [Neoarthrinium moseri]KAI1843120.1 hypothetical protein JX266_010647 [Neoarthrinium moseri]KAI1860460.1 hypothetical protein JX265_009859 [Neoarthrinium moseri]KAI1864953.1 hypothetical protein JN550_008499 [Neoarthrinium moseri]
MPSRSTHGTFTVGSDWGQIDLTSPNGSLMLDPRHPVSQSMQGKVTATDNTTIVWTTGTRDSLANATIPFLIENNGNPVDIKIQHGDDGHYPSDKQGWATAKFGQHSYKNDTVKENGYNAEFYTECPVDKDD